MQGRATNARVDESVASSTPLELLKAVKEVQERRIAVWREYDDAFHSFLHPPTSPSTGPVNGSLNNLDADTLAGAESGSGSGSGRGCAGCSRSAIPLTEDLLAQIVQLTTQALIECAHRLRSIQTELAHSNMPNLAALVDRIQTKENTLLRTVVHRDQLRKTSLKPVSAQDQTDIDTSNDDQDETRKRIAAFDESIHQTRAELAELVQEVYAETLELQLAEQ